MSRVRLQGDAAGGDPDRQGDPDRGGDPRRSGSRLYFPRPDRPRQHHPRQHYPRRHRARRGDLLGVGVVVVAVVTVNLPYLLHIVHFDPALLYSGLGVQLHSWLVPGTPQIEPNLGITAQALGHRSALDLLAGKVPWWNPYEGVGSPLAGEMQAASFFPPVLLLVFLDGQLPFHMLLELVGGISTFALLRKLQVRPALAAGAGTAFALCGTFAWLRNAAENPVAFLPLALCGVELARERASTGRRGGWVVIGLAVALMAVSGFPETAYLEGLFVVLWALARLPTVSGRRRARFVGILACGGITGLALAAPVLVAFADYLRSGYIAGHGGAIATMSLPGASSATLGFPWMFGPVFANASSSPAGATLRQMWGSIGGYLTPLVVVLALGGLLATSRHRFLRLLLGLWCVVCLGRTFGVPVLDAVANAIPGGRSIAIYRYAPPTWELAGVVLAALFLEELASGRVGIRRACIAFGVGAGALGAAALAGWSVAHQLLQAPDERAFLIGSLGTGVVVLGACLVVFTLSVRHPRSRAPAASVLAALMVVEAVAFFGTTTLSAPRRGHLDLAPVHYLQAHLGTQRFYTLGPLQPDYGSYFALAELDTNDLPVPEAWYRFVPRQLDPNSTADVFDGEYEVAPTGLSPAAALVRNLGAYEALGVRYVLAPAGMDLPKPMVAVSLSPTTWIYRLPKAAPLLSAPNGRCTVHFTGSYERFAVRCRSASRVIYQEMWMPGWSATVDGKATVVRRSGPLFQAIGVPAGASTVRFVFRPPYLDQAVLAAALGALTLVAGLVLGCTRRRS